MIRVNRLLVVGSSVLASLVGSFAMESTSVAQSAAVDPAVAAGTTYRVGPGQAIAKLQDIADSLRPGDVVELMGGVTYPGGVLLTAPGTADRKITIRGVKVNGARPVISGGFNTVEVAADHYVLEGLEIANASKRGIFHRAGGIVVRDSVVHDCPNGILGADAGAGSLLLEYTEVYRCGQGQKLHPIYMQTDETAHPGAVFRMQYCYVHDSLGGNSVKTRSQRNEIYYNWIQGAPYHDIELIGPDGQDEDIAREDSDVVGNVIVQEYQDKSHPVIRVGGDGTGQTWGRFRFVNNTILVGRSTTSAVFRLFDGLESVEMYNNVIHGRDGGAVKNVLSERDASWLAGRIVRGSHNWVTSGSMGIPEEWVNTVSGTDPVFTSMDTLDLRPVAGASPLVMTGNAAPPLTAGHEFPTPQLLPAFEPPAHVLLPVGAAVVRATTAGVGIGAY